MHILYVILFVALILCILICYRSYFVKLKQAHPASSSSSGSSSSACVFNYTWVGRLWRLCVTLLAASASSLTTAATGHIPGNGGIQGEDAQDSLATKPSVFCDVFINKYLVPNRQEGNQLTCFVYCIVLYKYTSIVYCIHTAVEYIF